MKQLLMTFLALATTGAAAQNFHCNLATLTKAERARQAVLHKAVFSAVTERRELADGFAFRIAPQQASIAQITQWIELERKCCPFFDFQLEIEPENGPVWLRLTGAEGIKQFIAAETGR